MIEAAMIWNEPNNKSHWDPEVDPGWQRFGRMTALAARAIAAENGAVTRVLRTHAATLCEHLRTGSDPQQPGGHR